MRFAFTHNRKDDKPKCLFLDLLPQGIFVFHLSIITTESVEVAGRQNSFAPFIRALYPRMKHGPFPDEESVAGVD